MLETPVELTKILVNQPLTRSAIAGLLQMGQENIHQSVEPIIAFGYLWIVLPGYR